MIIKGNNLPSTTELHKISSQEGLEQVLKKDPRISFLLQYGKNTMAHSTLQPGLDYYFNENKGEELNNIIEQYYSDCKDIIIIDDKEKNLTDINKSLDLFKYNLHLYKIIN